MPKGKGTYGSKVGRPPKTYQTGGMLTGASHEEGGVVLEAEGGEFITSVEATEILGADKLDAANENPEDYEIVPTSDAMFRSENYQLGGQVRPPTAPSIPQYKKGGKVK